MTMEMTIQTRGGAPSLQEYLEATRARFVAVHAAASKYIGVSEAGLRERRAGGESLGDVSQLEGKSLHGLRRTVVEVLRGMLMRERDDGSTFLEELAEDLIWVEGGPDRLRGRADA